MSAAAPQQACCGTAYSCITPSVTLDPWRCCMRDRVWHCATSQVSGTTAFVCLSPDMQRGC